MTLPLINVPKNAPHPESFQIIRIRNHSEDEAVIRKAVQFIIQYNGINQSIERMNEYRDLALKDLATLPSNDARLALEQLCYFVTEREK